MNNFLKKINKFINLLVDYRKDEYNFIKKYIFNKYNILDAGCGTGDFIKFIKEKFPACKIDGIDQNIDNVLVAKKLKANIKVMSITDLNIKNKFDLVLCSHVIQCMQTTEVFVALKKFHKSLKKNGLLIISTLNNYKSFYEHPENVRPYPLAVFYRFFKKTKINRSYISSSDSPAFSSMPAFEIIDVKFRYEPLILFSFDQHRYLFYFSSFLNRVQSFLQIKKFWKYTSYTIVLKKISVN
jgi:2-polyprenyl-3-methyl-5-hydroxy-6-metoxy-1,4-benzoquinol methylase